MLLQICTAILLIAPPSISRPIDTSDETNPSSLLLNWSKFLFSEDGIVQTLARGYKDRKDRIIPQMSSKAWDLASFLNGMGVNLQPAEAGIFDFFDVFDLSKMGLCNRDTCGDIYNILDKIRNSDFMLNLRILFALLKDQEGLDLLKMLLTNPSLLKTFLGNGGGGGGDGTLDKDKPDIAFVVDKDKKPGDYDDYYFDPDYSTAGNGDQVVTIKRPVHDVSISTGKVRDGHVLQEDEDQQMGSGIQTTPRTATDYFAYYYDQTEGSGIPLIS